MRVITGIARGMKLESPIGDSTRPTTEKVKEAVFSVLQFEIENTKILELFAGSGQLGIEALSRGARKAVFVDNNKKCCELIGRNVKKTGFTEKSEILNVSSENFLTRYSNEKYDIIFADPPYNKFDHTELLQSMETLLCNGGLIVFEYSIKEKNTTDSIGDLKLQKEYKYGTTKIRIYRKQVA